MQHDRLINALTITVQILISLVLFAIVLPFFILWRAPISLLYFTKKEKEEPKNADQEKERRQNRQADEEEEELKPDPPPDLHDRAFAPYTRQWTAFKSLPINNPLVTHWSRVACLSLLTIQTTLTLALLEKSLVYHIPWFVTHLSNTDYKTSKKKLWLNDLLLHVSWLLMTCAPIMGLLGVGLGVAYYTSKAVRYGRFSKGFVRKKGGRGYEDPDKAKEGKGKDGEANGVREAVMGVVDHVMHLNVHIPQLHLPHPHLHDHHPHEQREPETSPYGYPGYSEDILFEQPGDTAGAYQYTAQPAPAARFNKNPYTLAGIASIWTGQKEKMNGGYDGRDVRKRNFAEDIEMADWVGRK
ncbi:hypothetical protein BKA58DRAFT_465942 [Alternaria rosae]|uniref:uncharacterized protein n=1 Tax=Alternaria rosae TaxID=1187941 RepID=UPI001E8D06B9|nr:uncharacterized protein BKA58DRAFT_465942 [Alternaria rosae]KAH6878237.1 hypothetical protein BKA58DRAFT_465942 [Alternaria rosae]